MHSQAVVPRKKRILVVDDEADCSDLLAHFFRNQYEVVIARDGMDGMEKAANSQPDLIISDVSMPGLSGVDMVRLIRVRLGLRVPVIFLSALNEPKDIIAGISAGARHYLAKPVNLADLKQRVARALGQ
jgi:DNA-binding response OmpR family regulator